MFFQDSLGVGKGVKAVEPDRFALIVDFLAGFVPGGAEGCQDI